ncbi:MAG: (Fe-S)-binding protein [SAR202 cluster bacterium]|nr:(Fe-S)-binding protein [SAR202 cluster bacterium]
MVPPDDILGVIPTWLGVYILSLLMFGCATFILYRRVFSLILLGKPVDRFDQPLKRIVGAIPLILGQSKVLQRVSLKNDLAGLAHFLILWGFLSFFLSYLVFIYGDSISPSFSTTIFTETGVKAFAIYLDIVAALFLLVLVWAALRRWVATPKRLSFDLTQKWDAAIILILIGLLMGLSILTEATYVAAGGNGPTAAAIIGSAIGESFNNFGIEEGVAGGLHAAAWWAHLLVILVFAVYIPMSKHMHLICAPISFLLRDLEPMGTLPNATDLESSEVFGAAKIQDFTWKELLDGYACAVCGRCTDNCPANISGKTLSPMHIVENLKEHVLDVGPTILRGHDAQDSRPLVGPWITEESLWDCLTCGACEEECPVGVEHIDTIVDMRRNLVMEKAEMPETAMNVLTNMEQRGHPWRGTTYTRTDWAEGLDIKRLSEHPEAEVLFWVGCTAALEQRSQAIARSMVSVLKRANVNFAILGDEERCTGDPARRMGNEYLYQTLAKQNIEILARYDVKKVLTICPHCFNTIKNEYPHLGGNYEVVHYSEFVADLIRDGKIKPLATINATVAYHDSCYLGRHNDVYDAPREIAQSIPGVKLVEMERNRERGFCCGAGGGHMWIEESRGRRVNHIRTQQVAETGADTVAVSCPFCLQMFVEGVDSVESANKTQVRDLLEILDESLTPPNQ